MSERWKLLEKFRDAEALFADLRRWYPKYARQIDQLYRGDIESFVVRGEDFEGNPAIHTFTHLGEGTLRLQIDTLTPDYSDAWLEAIA